ncbi:MAG: 5-formyltetrahydrofolate cyclo-ligase [Gammaproteobacteria bacterium]|nr:5-formyltetrahydrofolate cyclo-ligase [Gammaproteobacteria bacterium]
MLIRSQLRQHMRRKRRALPRRERREAARRVAVIAATQLVRRRFKTFACFLSADGEIDTYPLMAMLGKHGCTVWLPCLGRPPLPFNTRRSNTLRFKQWRAGIPLRRGAFGIMEPATGPRTERAVKTLDVIFTPLVAYDSDGNRLGMGGGYYDRTFAFRRFRRYWRKPLLVGLAFSAQEVAQLRNEPWDVPLDAVLTQKGYRLFKARRGRCGDNT